MNGSLRRTNGQTAETRIIVANRTFGNKLKNAVIFDFGWDKIAEEIKGVNKLDLFYLSIYSYADSVKCNGAGKTTRISIGGSVTQRHMGVRGTSNEP
ncbi:hypothetical protein GGP41_002262 [Bipolaris sorokiniana]|uniref:Uncharacterized protein n=1 Tax=Cochliobolus sativus TaxID=45130 RepID=A0A8H6DQM0_COCSA|nr:hypothetical protein GGP41_002262 [Bipolaris sorokiniana]